MGKGFCFLENYENGVAKRFSIDIFPGFGYNMFISQSGKPYLNRQGGFYGRSLYQNGDAAWM